MKANERIIYSLKALALLAAITVTAFTINAASLRREAMPIQPAQVREWPSYRLIKEEANLSKEELKSTEIDSVKVHKVTDGETLSHIAERYNIDVDTIFGANHEIGDVIYPGDELFILPHKGVIHIVSEGDTLWSISNAYGVEGGAVASANNRAGDYIAVGEKLFIPGGRLLRQPHSSSRGGSGRFLWPTNGELSSGFGYRWGRLHAGIDLAAETGTRVIATRAGYITYAGWWSGYGYTILIDHSQGYTSLYAHLSEYSVSRGEYVAAGKVIGHVGDTGYSTGPHLHFEIRHYGNPVNPLGLLP